MQFVVIFMFLLLCSGLLFIEILIKKNVIPMFLIACCLFLSCIFIFIPFMKPMVGIVKTRKLQKRDLKKQLKDEFETNKKLFEREFANFKMSAREHIVKSQSGNKEADHILFEQEHQAKLEILEHFKTDIELNKYKNVTEIINICLTNRKKITEYCGGKQGHVLKLDKIAHAEAGKIFANITQSIANLLKQSQTSGEKMLQFANTNAPPEIVKMFEFLENEIKDILDMYQGCVLKKLKFLSEKENVVGKNKMTDTQLRNQLNLSQKAFLLELMDHDGTPKYSVPIIIELIKVRETIAENFEGLKLKKESKLIKKDFLKIIEKLQQLFVELQLNFTKYGEDEEFYAGIVTDVRIVLYMLQHVLRKKI